MRDILSFVRGAVANKEGPVPVLTRFCIYDGRIQGSNGRIAIDAPCPELAGINALVPADRFISAIDACDLEPKISLTEGNRLVVARKPFRAVLPTQPIDAFPHSAPTKGKRQKVPDLLPMLSRLRPFVGEDSIRMWCLCVYADGETAYATNSNMIASFPAEGIKLTLPVFLIDELLRIGEAPTGMTSDEHSITFFYGDSWLRSQLITEEWPVQTARELLSWKKAPPQMPPDLLKQIESIIPFCLDPRFPVVHFTEKGVSTEPGETQAEVAGASWPPIAFDSRNLLPMLRASTRFSIDGEKRQARFAGEGGFKGVMAGTAVQKG